jgi:hypothetical protein
MADDDQPVMPDIQPGAMPNVGQASQQSPVLDPQTVALAQAQQQSQRPPVPRPILGDLFAAFGIGGQNQTNAAGRPVSRLDHFEGFLGNFVQALGAGFANEGHGPGAAFRGAGAAMGAPYQQSLQNYQLGQQAQAQQAENQQRQAQTAQTQAQTGLTSAETTKTGLESDVMRSQAKLFSDPNLFQAMAKGQAPSNMEPDEQAVWNNAMAQASASRNFAPLTAASEKIMQQRTVNARTGLSDFVPDADSPTKVSKVVLDKQGNITSVLKGVLPPPGYAQTTTVSQKLIKDANDKWQTVNLTSTSRKDIPGLPAPATTPGQRTRADTPSGFGPSTTWQPKVSSDEKKKAELAENIAENANQAASIMIKRPELFGPAAGRFTSIDQMIGNNDPAISQMGITIHNIAMANSGVHGFRSQEGVEATEKLLLNNFRNGPQAVGNALKGLTNSTQTFIDNARPESYKTHSKQGGALKGMVR